MSNVIGIFLVYWMYLVISIFAVTERQKMLVLVGASATTAIFIITLILVRLTERNINRSRRI